MNSVLPSDAITQQPGEPSNIFWMPLPAPIEGVPPGLEYLTQVDHVIIQQVIEVNEVGSCFEHKNKYALKNDNGELKVSRIIRENNSGTCSFIEGMGDQCIVKSPPGELTGTVSQTPTLVSDGFHVFNSEKQKVLQIYGDIGLFERDFLILTAGDEKQEIGVISKQWAGFWKEAFTNADVFRVTFPKNLDVKLKAVLIGATFLIDYMFYERKN